MREDHWHSITEKRVCRRCRLKVKFENKHELFFSSISELLDLTDEQNKSGVIGHGAEGTNVGESL